jgi:hypothetical protein
MAYAVERATKIPHDLMGNFGRFFGEFGFDEIQMTPLPYPQAARIHLASHRPVSCLSITILVRN